MPTSPFLSLPTLGTPIAGGLYAGITTGPDGAAYALILLADKPSKRLDWPAAMAWAGSLQASLPTRPECSLLFANLRDQFKPNIHWISEQFRKAEPPQSDSTKANGGGLWFRRQASSWSQDFDYGVVLGCDEADVLYARAVRRSPLETFILLVALVAAKEEATAQVPA